TLPLFIVLVSCASDDEIADELIDYYNNEWIPIHGMKTYEIDTARNTVMDLIQELEENDGNESIALHEVDVVAIADNIIDRFESIQLKHRKVKKLNNMQIKAEKTGKELANSMIDYANGDIES